MKANTFLTSRGIKDTLLVNGHWIKRGLSKLLKEYALRINYYTGEEVMDLLIECCSEIYSDDGTLKGKEPEDLLKWMEDKEIL